MSAKLSTKQDRLWFYIVLPIAVLLLAGALAYGTYYALAAVQPGLVTRVPLGQVTFILYIFIAIVEWVLAISVIRRLRRAGDSPMGLVAPHGDPLAFRWLPAVSVFVGLNAIMVVFMAILSAFAGFPYYEGLRVWQRLLLVLIIPITAGFCEELIWRGYVITRLEARGRGRWATILLSAVAFALIHGTPIHWVFTLLFGIVAGYYYSRERNLVPLMISHAVIDLWSFAWYLFLL